MDFRCDNALKVRIDRLALRTWGEGVSLPLFFIMGHRVLEHLHESPEKWIEEHKRLISKRYGFTPTDEDILDVVAEYRRMKMCEHLTSRLRPLEMEAINIIHRTLTEKRNEEVEAEENKKEIARKRKETLNRLKFH